MQLFKVTITTRYGAVRIHNVVARSMQTALMRGLAFMRKIGFMDYAHCTIESVCNVHEIAPDVAAQLRKPSKRGRKAVAK